MVFLNVFPFFNPQGHRGLSPPRYLGQGIWIQTNIFIWMKQVGLDLWCRMQRKEFGKCIHCGMVNHVIIG